MQTFKLFMTEKCLPYRPISFCGVYLGSEPLLTKFGSVDACAAQKTRASFQQETIFTLSLL